MGRQPADSAAAPRGRHRRVPFLGHQIAEYLVAAALIAACFHTTGGAELALAAAGILLIVLNVVTAGPLGVIHVLSRRLHHAGDLVVAAILAVAPIVAFGRLHVAGVVLSEAVALLIIWMERSTRYVALPRRPATAGSGLPSGVAAAATVAALAPQAGRVARTAARHAGLVTGITRRVVRERRAASRRTNS